VTTPRRYRRRIISRSTRQAIGADTVIALGCMLLCAAIIFVTVNWDVIESSLLA
jgi:uncharacterized membrane protein